MAETLLELAERCEKAEGPDRDLDAEIMEALGIGAYRTKNGLLGYPLEAKPYTASLDAAMTLAEGRGGEVTFFKDGTAKAFLWQPYPLAVEAKAATPALALTAAALRARAAAKGGPNV